MSPLAVAIGVAWALAVSTALWPRRPAPSGLRARVAVGGTAGRRDVAAAVGHAVLALLARGSLGADRRPELDPRRLGRSLLAAAATCVVAPLAAPGVGAVVWAAPALRERRERRRVEAVVRRQLPEVVDLLALVTSAGLTVHLAVAAVARRADDPIGAELDAVVRAAAGGRRLGDALRRLPERLGDDVRPLVAALVATERDGTPLGTGLERLAGELRHDRRRRAEAAARRVPVQLLFPLVLCILPAFALLTVAPLLAGALSALRP